MPSTVLRAAVSAAVTAAVAAAVMATAAVALAAPAAAAPSPASAPVELPYGYDTCNAGFVWREARPADHVCVTVRDRTLTAQENAAAAGRVDPYRNGYGPKACKDGFVWREAFDGDLVCVTPDRRSRAKFDNAHARERYARNSLTVQDRIEYALTEWMKANGITNAGLVVSRDGGIVGRYRNGTGDPDRAVPVASLSKAITGVCVMNLIDNGRLTFATPLSSLPASFQADIGITGKAGLGRITIEQLLRHTSGIKYDTPDLTRLKGIPTDDTADLVLITTALKQPLGDAKETYNNINYAILGRVIQAVSGETYESYCKRIALTPRGAPNARLGIRGLGAYGGWEISPVEYARFARAFDPRERLLSPAAQRFIDGVAVTGEAHASLGVYVTKTAGGRNLWHFGAWQSSVTTPGEFGAFHALWDNGVSVTVQYDKWILDPARNALDTALREAAYGL